MKKRKQVILPGKIELVEKQILDENSKNNSEENLVGLCPNHHKMFHHFQFKKEIRKILEEKGYKLAKDDKLDFESDKKQNI